MFPSPLLSVPVFPAPRVAVPPPARPPPPMGAALRGRSPRGAAWGEFGTSAGAAVLSAGAAPVKRGAVRFHGSLPSAGGFSWRSTPNPRIPNARTQEGAGEPGWGHRAMPTSSATLPPAPASPQPRAGRGWGGSTAGNQPPPPLRSGAGGGGPPVPPPRAAPSVGAAGGGARRRGGGGRSPRGSSTVRGGPRAGRRRRCGRRRRGPGRRGRTEPGGERRWRSAPGSCSRRCSGPGGRGRRCAEGAAPTGRMEGSRETRRRRSNRRASGKYTAPRGRAAAGVCVCMRGRRLPIPRSPPVPALRSLLRIISVRSRPRCFGSAFWEGGMGRMAERELLENGEHRAPS